MPAACARSVAPVPAIARPERSLGANPEFPALLRSIANGDQTAFARFYDLTCQTIFGLTLRIVRDRGFAEEVTHDVYLQIWNQADRYHSDRGTPLAWALTIARSQIGRAHV